MNPIDNKGDFMKSMKTVIENAHGRVMAPILMYALGVPGFLVILLWFFFFRGS
jgi:hypothetical protein